jgi:hypothetical protein
MISINNSTEYLTLSINEAYKENGEIWDKVLVLRFPKAEFTEEQAEEIASTAMTVEHATKDKVTVYYVAGIVDKKTNEYFTDIWLKNPEVSVTDNLATKVSELEAIVNAIVGGEE